MTCAFSTPVGELLWSWQGELELFDERKGIFAERLDESATLLKFTNSDPQAELPVDLRTCRQAVVELSLSAPGALDIARRRINRDSAQQFQKLTDIISDRLREHQRADNQMHVSLNDLSGR